MRYFVILIAENITVRYGKNTVLEDVSIHIKSGESVAITGRNGSGKSTLIKVLCGVITPTKGSVTLDGQSVLNSDTRRRIGYVPQGDITFADLTVLDNLTFWGAAHGIKNVISSNIVHMLGLGNVLNKKVGTLSGGMIKRVCIAASILHAPDIFMLDEPFAAIDKQTKDELAAYIVELVKTGKTVIMTDHDERYLDAICVRRYNVGI